MINLKNIKNQKLNQIKLVEILFYTFPLSFIIGNLVLSLHLLLFLIVSLFLIKKQQLNYRFQNAYWLLIAFFLYFFLSTAYQFLSPGFLNEKIQNWPLESNPIFKSFLQIRFLILIIVVDTLFFNKILNLKKFFLSSLICTCFVSIDVIIQYIAGFDLFGYKSLGARNSGPFGDEIIAGSFLQKFSFFSLFYIFEIFKNKNFNKPLLFFIIILHSSAILLSGNRMPMILFLFGCFLIILFIKNLRLIMIYALLGFTIIFFTIATNDLRFKNINVAFLSEINIFELVTITRDDTSTPFKIELKEKGKRPVLLRSGHKGIYQTSIETWKERPFFGFGLKSFRIKCWETLARTEDGHCSTHSHNYYLELLVEAGIIGASLMIIFFLILLKNSFYYLRNYNKIENSAKNFLMPIIILFFLEIWPIKSTGSFFTTWNATFFWLIVSFLCATLYSKKTQFNKFLN